MIEWNSILPVLIPSVISLIGVLGGALYIRKSARERNAIDRDVAEDVNETNAFKVVTDQLFALNEGLRNDVSQLREEVKELKDAVDTKDDTIKGLEEDLQSSSDQFRVQLSITRQLANYIKLLISRWPEGAGPPPAPEPPIDWAKHLL